MNIKILMAILLLGMSTSAYSMVIYQNDFSSHSNGWSGGKIVNGKYKQKYSWSSIYFSMSHPAINDSVSIMFDVHALGDWEQSGWYEDDFTVMNRIEGWFNDVKLFDGNLNDGSNSFMFNNIGTWSTDKLKLKFYSHTTAWSEKFAIDNFKVLKGGAQALPEPATSAFFLMGLAGLTLLRRRTSR